MYSTVHSTPSVVEKRDRERERLGGRTEGKTPFGKGGFTFETKFHAFPKFKLYFALLKSKLQNVEIWSLFLFLRVSNNTCPVTFNVTYCLHSKFEVMYGVAESNFIVCS